MPEKLVARRLLPWRLANGVTAILAVVGSCPLFAQDVIPPEWGPIWQANLPPREKHPSLLFDEQSRTRKRERLDKPPADYWWRSFLKAGYVCGPAVEWWLLGDEAAARRARETLVNRPIWREATHGYLEPSSHRLADFVLAYDVLAAWPGLSATDHLTIRDKIAAEAEYYYKTMDSVPGGANYGNQRTLGASALGMAALTLCEYQGSTHTPAQWLARALYQIRREENFWFFRPDGLFVEGLGYTDYMACLFTPFAIAYERATGQYLYEDPRLREWLVFAAYQTTSRGELIFWGTCESGHGVRHLLLLSNARYGRDLAPLCSLAFNWRTVSPHGFQIPLALAVWEEQVEGERPPAARAFPRSQTVVLRDSWGPETVSVWFAGKDPTWPLTYRYGTYSQGDAGHFVITGWDEFLASDSGYDHWKSKDYYGAEFHNVLLIDGKGPEQDTFGEMTDIVTTGAVRRATVTATYQGCTVRRTLALVRGRYVVVADRVLAAGEHDYSWQVRSACPLAAPGSVVEDRAVTWPGLDAAGWRELRPGKSQLTTVMAGEGDLTLEQGRWRPMSHKPEFVNQVAVARWRGADTAKLFVLIPNLSETPEVKWQVLGDNDVQISGPQGQDRLRFTGGKLSIRSADGQLNEDLAL